MEEQEEQTFEYVNLRDLQGVEEEDVRALSATQDEDAHARELSAKYDWRREKRRRNREANPGTREEVEPDELTPDDGKAFL